MKCDYPNCNRDEDILFYCRYCHHSFCEEHRDPQNHQCPVFLGQSFPEQAETVAQATSVIMTGIQKAAEYVQKQAQQAYYDQLSRLDDKSKKELITRRLLASPDIFSLGSEVLDLIFGFGLIILVFGISEFIFERNYWGFIISGILIGTAFLPHELAHKFVAIKKGQFARYVLWTKGILFTLFTLIFQIGLIVPGFVAIVPLDPRRKMTKKEGGLVALAGPAINAIIGGVSLIIGLLIKYAILPLTFSPIFENIFLKITLFNGLIALFNCIPLWQLDGKKILNWNKFAYAALLAANVLIIIPPLMLSTNLF